MNTWQRNVRMIHQISEILDLDSAKSDTVADLIELIEAMREGLTQVNEECRIADSHINILFLNKLKSRPEWKSWATDMLRNSRLDSSNPADKMTFQELSELAMRHEKVMKGKKKNIQHSRSKSTPHASLDVPLDPRKLTQEEINAFVVQQMKRDDKAPRHNETVRQHRKKPSQEEINQYVVQQMRREQERKTRMRSHSQPEPRPQATHMRSTSTRCTFCGDSSHQYSNCWRRFRVAVEVPHGNFVPKRVEFRTEIPGQPPMYRSGFSLV
ncbi:hypothetical protein P875_00064885 [Aspergillus parasiticus SU-1]|uniref:Uncharacterized protein n=2 Tax=Aspergillus subgen. Circumdati TaxID=2720871 RepID=A0A0F0I953_ASPPU|nr:hypothetical protein BDV41DRAFT_268274 [Aspergillus transmontanensis]KJK63661.1 hypothetical protein P875_00064885 [Aspergillus parasiticus SU-1]